MAPTFVQAHSIGIAEGGGSSLTVTSFDVGSGTNRSLVAIVTLRDFDLPSPTVSSVVFNGSENFTYRGRATNVWATTISEVVEIWTLDNPSNATANVVATFSEAVDGATLHVLEYTGANNGIGANTGSATGNSAATSVTFSSGASTSVNITGLAIGEPLDAGSVVGASGTTERSEERGATYGSSGSGWSGDEAASGGSDTLGATVSTAVNWAMFAIELKASGGAAASLPPIRRQRIYIRM